MGSQKQRAMKQISWSSKKHKNKVAVVRQAQDGAASSLKGAGQSSQERRKQQLRGPWPPPSRGSESCLSRQGR
ncbi:hypothetical protein E4U43_001528 [Claviceps pusilla]|uniref:Uncharacterized protein n=1 Tax=Claviceps pusilla TaxID=123648 RepID=A0A9P7NGI6_9HYPO|nr:hypothetical protein E4U43_001528 [Claviceps pusilla]